jgi:hypothetical protein
MSLILGFIFIVLDAILTKKLLLFHYLPQYGLLELYELGK